MYLILKKKDLVEEVVSCINSQFSVAFDCLKSCVRTEESACWGLVDCSCCRYREFSIGDGGIVLREDKKLSICEVNKYIVAFIGRVELLLPQR